MSLYRIIGLINNHYILSLLFAVYMMFSIENAENHQITGHQTRTSRRYNSRIYYVTIHPFINSHKTSNLLCHVGIPDT